MRRVEYAKRAGYLELDRSLTHQTQLIARLSLERASARLKWPRPETHKLLVCDWRLGDVSKGAIQSVIHIGRTLQPIHLLSLSCSRLFVAPCAIWPLDRP